MAALPSLQRPLRIRCRDFPPEDVDALRSLLKLLKDYLKHPWTVVESGEAEVVFVDLDHASSLPDTGSARLVGCARKPREHAPGTIHRPLRAAGVLAVLSEVSAQVADHQQPEDDEATEWRYRLHCWPLEFEHWSRDALRVLASISPRHRSLKEIALCTGLPRNEIAATLGLLRKMDLLERQVERRSLPRVDEAVIAGWRGLAMRVGQLLGFAR